MGRSNIPKDENICTFLKEKRPLECSFPLTMQLGMRNGQTQFFRREKFNLDDPDGYKCYLHELRQEGKTYFSVHSGGGSVMLWGGISAAGKMEFAMIPGPINKDFYMVLVENYMLSYEYCIPGDSYLFMQDIAAPHSAHVVRDWFIETGTTVLPCSAKSPDLNPIENVRASYCAWFTQTVCTIIE